MMAYVLQISLPRIPQVWIRAVPERAAVTAAWFHGFHVSARYGPRAFSVIRSCRRYYQSKKYLKDELGSMTIVLWFK